MKWLILIKKTKEKFGPLSEEEAKLEIDKLKRKHPVEYSEGRIIMWPAGDRLPKDLRF